MFVSRTGLLVAIALAGSAAWATPAFTGTFTSTYKLKPGSHLGSQPCAACHVGRDPKRNPYGLALERAMKKAGVRKVTPAVLKSVEKLDSDKDGYTNVQEIKADHRPGDAKDHPTAHLPPPKTPAKAKTPAPKR